MIAVARDSSANLFRVFPALVLKARSTEARPQRARPAQVLLARNLLMNAAGWSRRKTLTPFRVARGVRGEEETAVARCPTGCGCTSSRSAARTDRTDVCHRSSRIVLHRSTRAFYGHYVVGPDGVRPQRSIEVGHRKRGQSPVIAFFWRHPSQGRRVLIRHVSFGPWTSGAQAGDSFVVWWLLTLRCGWCEERVWPDMRPDTAEGPAEVSASPKPALLMLPAPGLFLWLRPNSLPSAERNVDFFL